MSGGGSPWGAQYARDERRHRKYLREVVWPAKRKKESEEANARHKIEYADKLSEFERQSVLDRQEMSN